MKTYNVYRVESCGTYEYEVTEEGSVWDEWYKTSAEHVGTVQAEDENDAWDFFVQDEDNAEMVNKDTDITQDIYGGPQWNQ